MLDPLDFVETQEEFCPVRVVVDFLADAVAAVAAGEAIAALCVVGLVLMVAAVDTGVVVVPEISSSDGCVLEINYVMVVAALDRRVAETCVRM